MNPGRALTILLTLIIPFTVIYAVPISTSPEFASDTTGIYRIRPEGSIEVADGKIESVTTQNVERLYTEGIPVLWHAFHFSLLSAFHIGWRELNVGNWLARLQKQEYTLRARGWVRTVSGVQSLISIYLLAIWALSYFGRPFG